MKNKPNASTTKPRIAVKDLKAAKNPKGGFPVGSSIGTQRKLAAGGSGSK